MQKGIAASPGIEIGKVYIYKEESAVINRTPIPGEQTEAEIKRLNKAVASSRTQLKEIKDKAESGLGKAEAGIFEAHLMILEDTLFLDEIREKIRTALITAEHAVSQIIEKYADTFGRMGDEYLKERAADIRDIGERMIKNILGIETRSLSRISERVIVIAKDLTPSDTAQLDRELVAAFAVDMGGRTSHTAIMARSMEIPAVVGLSDISRRAKDGDLVVVDGNKGIVVLNPDEEALKRYRKEKEEYLSYMLELCTLRDQPCVTGCGRRRVEILANIGTPRDCAGALANGAEGSGLYRTEFLYMDRTDLPGEEEQFEAYKAVAETMAPRPVTIRTLDIGGDKKLPYMDMPEECNPFLGWRAIRLCLDRVDILKTQLRAVLRASRYGKIRIMYPMISGVEEIRRANRVLKEAGEELDEEGITYDKNLEVGIMIEIPSAAVIADVLAKEADFFSIGTNDLVQYTLAVDRMNEHISYLYEPLHPAVLRLIKNVVDAAHRAGIRTGMCGEMAGDAAAAPILLGLGLDELSMSAVSIPCVKRAVRSITYEEARELAKKVLCLETSDKIRMLTDSFPIV